MSTAMEKMVANMLGFTPAEMHQTLQGFQDMILTTKATLERIEGKVDEIATQMEGQLNDTRDGNDAGGSGDDRKPRRGRGRAGSDATGDNAGS